MEQLKKARKAKGLTQAELAAAAGLSTPFISHIETGKKSATMRTLERIAEALDAELVVDFMPRKQ